MSPLSWAGPDQYDHDDLEQTGRLPDEEFGRIDFAEAFGVCVEQPSPRERRTHYEDGRGVRSATAVATPKGQESL